MKMEFLFLAAVGAAVVVSAVVAVTRASARAILLWAEVCLLFVGVLIALARLDALAWGWGLLVVALAAMFARTFASSDEAAARRPRSLSFGKALGAAAAGYLAIVLVLAVARPPFVEWPAAGAAFSSPAALGGALWRWYLFPAAGAALAFFVALRQA